MTSSRSYTVVDDLIRAVAVAERPILWPLVVAVAVDVTRLDDIKIKAVAFPPTSRLLSRSLKLSHRVFHGIHWVG